MMLDRAFLRLYVPFSLFVVAVFVLTWMHADTIDGWERRVEPSSAAFDTLYEAMVGDTGSVLVILKDAQRSMYTLCLELDTTPDNRQCQIPCSTR